MSGMSCSAVIRRRPRSHWTGAGITPQHLVEAVTLRGKRLANVFVNVAFGQYDYMTLSIARQPAPRASPRLSSAAAPGSTDGSARTPYEIGSRWPPSRCS
jgi:hypothetical protein